MTLFGGNNEHFDVYLQDITCINHLNAGLMELEKSYGEADRVLIRKFVFDLASELLSALGEETDFADLTPRQIKESIIKSIDHNYYIMQFVLGWLVIIGSTDKIDHMKQLGIAYAMCLRIITDIRDLHQPDKYNICHCYSHNELIRVFQDNITILIKGLSTARMRIHYKEMISQFKEMLTRNDDSYHNNE